MNLFLQFLENSMNLNAPAVLLILLISLFMTGVDSVMNNLFIISGFHTLGVRGNSTQI